MCVASARFCFVADVTQIAQDEVSGQRRSDCPRWQMAEESFLAEEDLARVKVIGIAGEADKSGFLVLANIDHQPQRLTSLGAFGPGGRAQIVGRQRAHSPGERNAAESAGCNRGE